MLGFLYVDIVDFVLISHIVPAERVRRLVPHIYELQTFHDDTGREMAFISSTCFQNVNFRPAVGWPRLTFFENTFRVYVSFRGRAGVYFVGRYVEGPRPLVVQRPISRDVWIGRYETQIDSAAGGYERYESRTEGPRGRLHFHIRALEEPAPRPPFESADELVQFLTYRPSGLFTSSLGLQGHMPVSHRRLKPRAGQLVGGSFEFWERLEVLGGGDNEPYAVLAEPRVAFVLHRPRPAL